MDGVIGAGGRFRPDYMQHVYIWLRLELDVVRTRVPNELAFYDSRIARGPFIAITATLLCVIIIPTARARAPAAGGADFLPDACSPPTPLGLGLGRALLLTPMNHLCAVFSPLLHR